ncbi:MAG: ATP-binding protein, partial [Deltaproteobacteria bacterium]|nr:ATP-binding protein [Deltaproteobacteria bacterium]
AIIFIVSLISLMPSFFTNTMQVAYGAQFQIPSFAEVFILVWVAGILYAIKRYNFLAREEEISVLNEKILLEKKIVSIQSDYIKNQNYILETLFDYFRSNLREDIYEFIADRIYQTGNIKLLIITEYNPDNSKFTLKAFRGEEHICEEFSNIINSHLKSAEALNTYENKEFILEKLLSSHITKIEGGLYESILRSIDKDTISNFAEKYSLGNAYSIGFSSGNILYGAATIITEKNNEIENSEFLEILINVLSLILQKWNTDLKLKKSEELHRAIFEYSDDCIYILDQNGIILSISPSFERITGFRIKDYIGRPMSDIIHPDDIENSYKMLRDVINNSYSQRNIIRVLNSKGEVIYGEFAATKFLMDNGETGLLGIGRDVTERIKNEELIKKYQKELEIKTAKIETVGIMATGVLHDLNNILMNISAKIEKIKEYSVNDSLLNNYITDIDKTLTVAKRLSRSLFDISGGKVHGEEETSLKNLISETLNLLIREPKYKIIKEIPENIPDTTLSPTHFTQIFSNLVINSIQAMPDGGSIKISVSPKNIADRKFIVLSISDTGKGIPDEIQKRIFEPFFTTKPDGTGLGLPTVRTLIKSYGGEIEFSSEEGKGTTFTVTLPVKESERSQHSSPNKADSNREGRKIKTVLIVDDDKNIRELAEDMLIHIGFNAFSASDSISAIECVKNKNPDAVILDLHLADSSDAIKTLSKIREIRRETRVIICSGSPKDPFLIRYTKYGFDGALPKPFNLKDLENVLK